MKTLATIGLAACAIAATSACSPRVETLGNAPRKEQLAELKPGLTKAQVRQTLGSPSSVAMFDKDTWYYISKRESRYAFFKPNVREQNVIIVHFNGGGVVRDIKRLGLKDAREVRYVKDETPTMGREDGLITSMMRTLLDQRGLLGSGGTSAGDYR
jgi:outer membrane protein assembly factor BamE (lipoprotein component of BamABCDE complex)